MIFPDRHHCPQHHPKVIFCGSPAVGKTTIFHRILEREIGQTSSATMGAAFGVAQIVVNGQSLSLNLWDTAGQEEYRSLVNLYFKSTAVAVIVFDLTSPETFSTVRQWHNDIIDHCGGSDPKIIVVGNKLDLRSGRAVFEDQIEELISKLQCGYFEVSALEGINIDVMFRGIGLVAAQKAGPDETPRLESGETQSICC
jgi:small GTP-binding protein